MKKIYEFYYDNLEVEPRSTYELCVTRETEATVAGDAFKISSLGRREPVGKFRLNKNRLEIATINSKRIWMVRVPGESLENAKQDARIMLYQHVQSWASRLLDEA